MKTLITGGSGFIGKKLLSQIDNSTSFDLFGDENNTIFGDITSCEDIQNASKGFDGILHAAAISRVSDCEENPIKCLNVNVIGTMNVIEAAVQNNLKWLAFVSTGEVVWIQNDDVKIFKRINNIYGLSKLTSELLLDIYAEKKSLNTIVFRISSVVFGDISDNPNKVFPIFVTKALKNEPIVINNTTVSWDFIHVNDVVSKINEELKTIDTSIQTKEVKEVDIFSGVKLNLLDLATIIHYLTQSSSTILLKEASIQSITKEEYERVLQKNTISDAFITLVEQYIYDYKERGNNGG